jgi:glycosyltransferase involved in cell wall biosynthesis
MAWLGSGRRPGTTHADPVEPGEWWAAEAGGFRPIKLLDLELCGPEIRPVSSSADDGRHGRARLLVRLHGVPLGEIDLETEHGVVSAGVAVDRAWDELGDGIAAHLAEDGLLGESQARAALPRPATPPRCEQERRDFARNAPPASVVIATRDRPEELARTLDDALRLEYPHFEVIVVDNAPATDATRRLVESRQEGEPRLRYVCEPLAGLAAAHNRGLEAAEGAVVAFTDDDVVIDPFWLVEIARAFELAEDVACVTGLILPAELETPAQLWIEDGVRVNKGHRPKLFDLGSNRPSGKLFPYAAGAFGSGANMAFRAETLRRLGGFDPATGTGTLARGGDDLAAFFTVIAAGHTLAYQPTAVVRHTHRRASEALRTQMYDYGAGLAAFLTKIVVDHPGRLPDIAWRIPFGAAHAVRSRARGPRGRMVGLPDGLVARERLGMLAGPAGYVIERRRRRALYTRHAHRAAPREPGRT